MENIEKTENSGKNRKSSFYTGIFDTFVEKHPRGWYRFQTIYKDSRNSLITNLLVLPDNVPSTRAWRPWYIFKKAIKLLDVLEEVFDDPSCPIPLLSQAEYQYVIRDYLKNRLNVKSPEDEAFVTWWKKVRKKGKKVNSEGVDKQN